MSSLRNLLVAALTVLSGVAANAHADTPSTAGFHARSIIAAHEAAPSLDSVVHRARHRHHHKHRMHRVAHAR